MQNPLDYRFSVAPMMEWTDRHCRMFHRTLSRKALLFTEMVTADAVIHGNRDQLIGFSKDEHPLALQLGGSEPHKLVEAARIAEDFGYDEVNLNCGCPSDRVQAGAFGACLMRAPDLVAECVAAMQNAVSIPVTVKHRIGVDDDQPDETLFRFVETVADPGCSVFTVHARKAWLKGLSPKENRDIPPLDYPLVYRLKTARPDLTIVINGGIQTVSDSIDHLDKVDGVMLGRAAYQSPRQLLDVDPVLFSQPSAHQDMVSALADYRGYVARQLEAGISLHAMTRHILGAFAGQRGARAFRRTLSEFGPKPGAGLDVFDAAIAHVIEPAIAAQ